MKYFVSYMIDYGNKANPSYGNSIVEIPGFLHSTAIDGMADKILKEINNKRTSRLTPKAKKIVILNFKALFEVGVETNE